MIVEQTPAGIQEQYTSATAYQAGGIHRSPPSAGYPAAVVGGKPVSLGYQGCLMALHLHAEQGDKVVVLDHLLE